MTRNRVLWSRLRWPKEWIHFRAKVKKKHEMATIEHKVFKSIRKPLSELRNT